MTRETATPNLWLAPAGETMAVVDIHLATAMGRLRGKMKYRPVVFELMPPEFTLLELQRTVERLARGERLVVHDAGRDALRTRPFEARRPVPVRDHRLHGEPRARLDDRAHVAAAAGDEDDRRLHRHVRRRPSAPSPARA